MIVIKITNSIAKNSYLLKSIFWLIALLVGVLQAWSNRFNLSSEDAVSYLDIGDAYFRGDWHAAINTYWSPLYSWLLGLTISTFKPSTYWEFFVVKLVNLSNLIFAIICFDFFLRKLILHYQKRIYQASSNKNLKIPEWLWIVLGYTLFLWSALKWIGVDLDSPDMVSSAFVYLAVGLLLHLQIQTECWFNFIILGVVLGLGYLSKTVMFPLAFVFFVVALFAGGSFRQKLPRVLASFLAFTIIVTPFITAISLVEGRLTFGDTGKLNYVWYVSRNINVDKFFQGEEPENGIPKHPPQTIFNHPLVYEFKTPFISTSHFWYEPSYWFEGLKLKFNLNRQIKILIKNIFFYFKLFLLNLILGYIIIVFTSSHLKTALKDLAQNWSLLVVAMAGLGFYLLGIDLPHSFLPTRYIAPFIVILFAGVFSSVHLLNSEQSKRLILVITIIVSISIGTNLVYNLAKDVKALLKGTEHTYWNIAQDLNRIGVRPGDQVAVIGHKDKNTYWARLARVQILTEVFKAEKFWEENTATQSEVFKAIKKTGSKIIVQQVDLKISNSITAVDWQRIGNVDCYVYRLDKG